MYHRLDSSISSELFSLPRGPVKSSLFNPVLLQEEIFKTKLTLFILDSSISSKLFFLGVEHGSYNIDPATAVGNLNQINFIHTG